MQQTCCIVGIDRVAEAEETLSIHEVALPMNNLVDYHRHFIVTTRLGWLISQPPCNIHLVSPAGNPC